jgi:hypothetical protein
MTTRRVRIWHDGRRTRIVDLERGEELQHVTSVEIFQVGLAAPVYAVIKLIVQVDRLDLEAHASMEERK